MNVKTWIPLVMAVGLGAVALVVAKTAMSRPSRGNDDDGKTVAVVVAKHDVPVGSALVAEDLLVRKVPTEAAPTLANGKIEELVGRTVTTPIVKGQPVLETLLAPAGSGAGVQGLIDHKKGMRAITIEVNEFTGLAGLLMPNSKVDVIAAMRDDKSNQQVSRTILQNIRVIAIGRQMSAPAAVEGQPAPPPSNNVTLLVNSKQAQSLQLACQGGRPWLVLRSPLDDSEEETEGTTMTSVLGQEGANPWAGPATRPTTGPSTQPTTMVEAPVAPKIWVMKIIRGGVESRVSFPLQPVSDASGTATAGAVDAVEDVTPGQDPNRGPKDPFATSTPQPEPTPTPSEPTPAPQPDPALAGTHEENK